MTKIASNHITHRRVLNISLPIVLSNATVPLLGAVDTGVVGQLGLAAPIGAVGIGSIILATVYGLFGFLRMGTSGMTSQARGREDHAEVSAIFIRSVTLGLLIGLVLTLLQVPILNGALTLSPASEEVERLASQYVSIRILSAPAAVALFGMSGWMIAREDTRSVLYLQLYLNGLNVVLDFVFVIWLNLGVPGVAYATFLSEWTALALGFWLCRSAFRRGYWRDRERVFERSKVISMMSANTDIMVRSLLLQASFAAFLFFAADFGDVILAANQVLVQFLLVAAYALDGFAFSAEALVGLSVGGRDPISLLRSVQLSSIWGMIAALVLAVSFLLLGTHIIEIMTTSQEVRLTAKKYLAWVVVAPLIGGPSWILDGIFIGAMRTSDMRNGMIASFAVFCAAMALLLPLYENHGLWLSLQVMFVARAITLAVRYSRIERSMKL